MRLHRLLLVAMSSSSIFFAHTALAWDGDYQLWEKNYGTLGKRGDVLSEPVRNDFLFEVRKLGMIAGNPDKNLLAVEDTEGDMEFGRYSSSFQRKDVKARDKFLQDHLTDDQRKILASFNEATSDSFANDIGRYPVKGEPIPATLRAYMAGANNFSRFDLQHAATRFTEALAIQDGQYHKLDDADKVYQVWSAYMLGRTFAKLKDTAKAQHYFSLTRDMIVNGAGDPLGLGVASYGEEARLALNQAGGVAGENDFNASEPRRMSQFREAIRLYSLQHQTGSRSGYDSLHILAKDIKNVPSDFTLLMKDELARRLFLTYVRGYLGPVYDTTYYSPAQVPGGPDNRKELITALLPLFPVDDKDIADALAAAALEVNNSQLTSRYLAQKQSALATWVQAKQAVLQKDFEKAAKLYEQAIQQRDKEAAQPSIDPADESISQEQAFLTLARGHYVDSLKQFYGLRNNSSMDYLATRVLTIDELKEFIDKNVPDPGPDKGVGGESKEDFKAYLLRSHARELRYTYARRLMRLGKYQEALPFFADYAKSDANEYARWLDATKSDEPLKKAEALYHVAVLEREKGPNLFGGELIQLQLPDEDMANNPYVTQGERDRLKTSRAESALKQSFRRMATDHALEAVKLVPAKSQAFAAILCRASNWVRPLDENEADGLYKRYAREGAVVPWATHFGHGCPEPDFASAKHTELRHLYVKIKGISQRHPLAAIGAPVLALVVAGLLMLRHKRKTS